MESKVVFVRERPLGTAPFALGVAALFGAATAVWLSRNLELAAALLGAGVVLIVVGVQLFRRPHRVELAGAEVLVAPRFGPACTWRWKQVQPQPGAWRVLLEAVALAALLPGVAYVSGHVPLGGIAPALIVAGGYADAWRRWRLAPRLAVEDERGERAVMRLDGIPGLVETIAARTRPLAA